MTGVPIDSDYNNTAFFTSASARDTYFSGKVTHTLSNYYYQREGIGIIKVQLTYAQCYKLNYMRFKNNSYENKWFYAFILKAEYISDTVTALHYSIDVMQTWAHDYTLEQCFIERQHSETDGIGDNIVPENVDVGEQVFNNYDELQPTPNTSFKDMYAVVAVCDVNESAVRGTEQNNIYSGAVMYAFDVNISTQLADLNSFLASYIQRPDAIVGMYMCPKTLCVTGGGSGDYGKYFLMTGGNAPQHPRVTLPALDSSATLNGYAPKNKKLLTYPYNFLSVDNAMGNSLTLRYEFFGMGLSNYLTPSFFVDGCTLQPVQMRLRPSNYKGSGMITPAGATAYGKPVNSEMLTISNYPLCSWNFDTYKAWIAQNAVPEALNMVGSLAHVGMSLGLPDQSPTSMTQTWGTISNSRTGVTEYDLTQQRDIINGVTPAQRANIHSGHTMINSITGFLGRNYAASIAADQLRGSLNGGNVNVANRMATFFYGRKSCNAQTAKRIDDYFTMFGYAQNIVARPNRRARQRFTYVKTVGCEISGQIPNDDQLMIKSIYDAGIRFWVDPDDIGNYATANGTL